MARDYANTHKHAGDRAAEGQRVGRVLKVTSDRRRGQRITVVFATLGQTSTPKSRDALRLLEGCEAAWRPILADLDLEPADPPEDGLI
jgi:hypothetical protein